MYVITDLKKKLFIVCNIFLKEREVTSWRTREIFFISQFAM